MFSALTWLSLSCYLVALVLLWQYTTASDKHTPSARSRIISLSLIGLIAHFVDLYIRVVNQAPIADQSSLSLGQSISSVAAFATLLFILLSMVRATLNLGLAILPATILGLLAGRWLNPINESVSIAHPSFEWHIALSIISFALLSLAFAQSILILIQDKQLRTHSKPQNKVSFISLPALQSMETMLFQFITLGFMLLSLTLAAGLTVNHAQHGSLFSFNHHIVLTLLTWLAYAILLLGRYFSGWRGRQASIYTIICYSLFLLGYFGTRAVRELIIH